MAKVMLLSTKKETEAISYYDKASAIDPSDKDALYGKAPAFFNRGNYPKGDYAEALQYSDKVLSYTSKL